MASTPESTPGSTTPTPRVSTAPRTSTSLTSPVVALQELVSQSVQTAVSASFDSLMSTLDARIRAALGTTPSSNTPPSSLPLLCLHSQLRPQQDPATCTQVRMCARLLFFFFSQFRLFISGPQVRVFLMNCYPHAITYLGPSVAYRG